MTCSDKYKRKGSVLFIVLIFILAVTTLVLISSIRMSSEADFLESEFSRLRAYTKCISGVEFLKNRLATGTINNIEFLDGMTQPHIPRLIMDGRDLTWHFLDIIKGKYVGRRSESIRSPDMMFTINLQDSAGLINFFKIEKTLLKNLFDYHNIESDTADEVIDSLKDWMDKDSFTRPDGAESEYYMKNFGYTAANRLLDSQEELLLVKGMDKNIYNHIGKLLDFTIDNRGINPNTMPQEAFHLFKSLGDENIRRIIQKREENTMEGPAELTLASGYNFSAYPRAFQFFTSNTTYVKIKSKMDENRYFYIQFKLNRISGAGSMRQGRPGGFRSGRSKRDRVFTEYFNVHNWEEGTELRNTNE
ncbi:MAG: general secretion pathway protein GspK [bacterium]|nr:general secretion pathway protein GspK [bacterium]